MTAEQDASERQADNGLEEQGGGDTEMTAPEYEFLDESAGRERGDAQALAPATEEQAAGAHLPDPNAAAEDEEPAAAQMQEDESMDDAGTPQQAAEQVKNLRHMCLLDTRSTKCYGMLNTESLILIERFVFECHLVHRDICHELICHHMLTFTTTQ